MAKVTTSEARVLRAIQSGAKHRASHETYASLGEKGLAHYLSGYGPGYGWVLLPAGQAYLDKCEAKAVKGSTSPVVYRTACETERSK